MKKLFLLLLCVIMLLSAVSCSDNGNDSAGGDCEYIFTDSEGTKVELKEKPNKIAVLFSSYADIWQTAGGTVNITVGETVERGFAYENAIIVDPGSGHSTIDTETLVAQQPNIVIGTTDYECQRKAVEFCRSIGIPGALFRVECFDDYLNVLKIFCKLTGNEENYRKYGVSVKEKIDLLLSDNHNGETKKILFVRAGSSAKSTKAKTSEDNFVCKMLRDFGTTNIADSDIALTGMLSIEVILEKNPDYLFISTMGNEVAAKEYMDSQLASDGWNMLDCVKKHNYCYLPKDLFHFKPNSRWAEAYEYLISILYSEN